jgi:hypothetical protein
VKHLHSFHIFHGDLRWWNIPIDSQGRPRLLLFPSSSLKAEEPNEETDLADYRGLFADVADQPLPVFGSFQDIVNWLTDSCPLRDVNRRRFDDYRREIEVPADDLFRQYHSRLQQHFAGSQREPPDRRARIALLADTIALFCEGGDIDVVRAVRKIVSRSLRIGRRLDRVRLATLKLPTWIGHTLPLMETLWKPNHFSITGELLPSDTDESWSGWDADNDRPIAVKYLRIPSVAEGDRADFALTSVVRVFREIACLMYLVHPAILPIYGWAIGPAGRAGARSIQAQIITELPDVLFAM